ncbi:MAG: hypothetical protein HY329_18230 [Chloroflexi bacterium]|nr:hypothetical protein [Chloroflexota bacterium]
MSDLASRERLRVLLDAGGFPTNEALLAQIEPEWLVLTSGLERLRALPLGDTEPAHELRLDPEGWR